MDSEQAEPALKPGCKLIVFTDLDGTLLDHRTYEYAPASPALEELKRADVALILASSKTAGEIAPLRAELGFAHCEAIVENGAGILMPFEVEPPSADERRRLLAVLNGLPNCLRQSFSGFADWTTAQIAERTGLSTAHAARASRRSFTEPGIWRGSEEQFAAFCRALREQGVCVRRGGRFPTLSFGHTKAERMTEIVKAHRRRCGPLPVAALGDAPNDIEMLKSADIAIIIENPDHPGVEVDTGGTGKKVWRSRLPGPAGWNEEVLKLLEMVTGKDWSDG